MSDEIPTNHTIVCAHCRTVNASGTVVCRSCGVNIVAFASAQERLQATQAEAALSHYHQLAAQTSVVITEALQQDRQQFSAQLRVASMIIAVLGIFLATSLGWYSNQRKQQDLRLENEYKHGIQCLATREYRCARDSFATILQEAPDYPDAQSKLLDARYQLGFQLFQAEQWELAAVELEEILMVQPENLQALSLLRITYDRWYDVANAHSDWITALRVDSKRKARFPDMPTVPRS